MSFAEVRAPVGGVVVALRDVPDDVFAGGLAGDGLAVDPTSEEVVAPIAGTVTQLHRGRHALAVRSDAGLEILVHVGLDTVKLDGRGFTALVEKGARVTAGQPLLRFDADFVARHAKSLLTVVAVTAGGRPVRRASGLVEAGKGVLFEVEPAAASPGTGAAGAAVYSREVALPNAQGLHARPAAVLARAAQRFAARVRLRAGGASADAKSIVALLGLSTRQGDLVQLEADGPDAAAALAELERLLESGCGEAPGGPPLAPPARASAAAGELAGVPASPGVAVGVVVQYRAGPLELDPRGGTPQEERARLDAARREAALQLAALERGAPSRAELLRMQRALLDDPELVAPAEESVAAGQSAALAWHAATERRAAALEALESPLLRERAADLRDVGRRVLMALGAVQARVLALEPGSVLVAEELGPSELAALDETKLAALCTTGGGPTSHVAIVAQGLGLPAVCGLDPAALSLAAGTRVVVDGGRGVLAPDPPEARVEEVRAAMARRADERRSEQASAQALARTRDGRRIEVAANVKGLAEARAAVEGGAEAVGLLRSEYLFLGRDTAPSEAEQAETYRAIAGLLGPSRPLVIRTLDVGGDKPLPYLQLPAEKNPFLGVRGVRLSLDHPDLFRVQLRAICAAAPAGDVRVMFPMISGVDELRAARALLEEERRGARLQVGIMIEVPSAVALADHLAREADFFSIGTNDLTQYLLAMDRGHPSLAKKADAVHPAVLRGIASVVTAAHAHGRWVGVCGGVASEPLAVPLLVGLGVDELSVSVPSIAPVKAAIARWSVPECEALAAEALTKATAAEVRALLGTAGPGRAPAARLRKVGT